MYQIRYVGNEIVVTKDGTEVVRESNFIKALQAIAKLVLCKSCGADLRGFRQLGDVAGDDCPYCG
jgi:rubrerythrin